MQQVVSLITGECLQSRDYSAQWTVGILPPCSPSEAAQSQWTSDFDSPHTFVHCPQTAQQEEIDDGIFWQLTAAAVAP